MKLPRAITFCQHPFSQMALHSSGYVSMCCDQTLPIGKVEQNTDLLKDIWNSDVAKAIRASSTRGELHDVCKSGGTCTYFNKPMVMWEIDDPPYPLHLEICLPDTHCNIGGTTPTKDNPACLTCHRNFTNPTQVDITDLLCEKSRPLIKNLYSLRILGTAEPFWKDYIFKVLDKIEYYKHRNIEIKSVTNGLIFTEDVARRYIDLVRHSNIMWSFDAATPETYKKIRRKDFNLTAKNFKKYNELRNKSHKVGVYNNINLINIGEMTQMVEQAHAWGADYIVFVPTMNYKPDVDLTEITINEEKKSVFKKAAAAAQNRARELKFKLMFYKQFSPPTETARGILKTFL